MHKIKVIYYCEGSKIAEGNGAALIVPRVGDCITFTDNDGHCISGRVVSVSHEISEREQRHLVYVSVELELKDNS